jgi:F420-dependent oxidoreductase-like protein
MGVDEMGPSLRSVVDQIGEVAEAGFRNAWVAQRSGRDALTVLAVAGREVPGVGLGVAVVPTYPRHPLALAAQARTVQEAVGGRLTLGLGVSHRPIVEGQWGFAFDRPARYLREYLSALMPLLRGESVAVRGATVTAVGAVDGPAVAAPSVLVGALGPEMLRVAGELTDGTVTTWATPAALDEHVVPVITKAAGSRTPRVAAGTPVCVTSDEAGGRRWVAENLAVVGQLPTYRAILDRGYAAGPEDAVVVGDESSVERQLRRLFDAGATEVLAYPIGSDEERARTVEFLAALAGPDRPVGRPAAT